ncbi:hypothetical protein A2357_01650 [Candidatus Nomurabacteria bacterium RIFOXYB1_FULL_43_14]|nr:MAG: hypothetical protein A2357_01650 [Candidatus Nomurabacteria bacterium RIFOXYB1_FULL_43_14]
MRPRRPKNPLGVSSRRAKRKGVWGKEFLPACFPRRRRGRGGKRLVPVSAGRQSPQKLIP